MMKPPDFIIVDDDTTSNLICEFSIRRVHDQARIEMFTNPQKALDMIAGTHASKRKGSSILFLDINMPSMTAWDFLEIFQKYDEKVRSVFSIYILSSSIEDFVEEKKQFPFVSGFLTKPMTKDAIEATVF